MAQVAVTMFSFGIGAAVPLLLLGSLSREAMTRWRGRLLSARQMSKLALGLIFVALCVLVLTGLDKSIKTTLVDASPQWMTDLTTRL